MTPLRQPSRRRFVLMLAALPLGALAAEEHMRPEEARRREEVVRDANGQGERNERRTGARDRRTNEPERNERETERRSAQHDRRETDRNERVRSQHDAEIREAGRKLKDNGTTGGKDVDGTTAPDGKKPGGDGGQGLGRSPGQAQRR